MEISKKYSPRGKLSKKKQALATFDSATPWKDANVAFNWINFEYPLEHGHIDWEILLVLQDCILHEINGTSKILTPGMGCFVGPTDRHALFYPKGVKNHFQGVSIIVRDSYLRNFLQMYSPILYNQILAHNKPLYFSISHNSIEKYSNLLLSIQDYDNKDYSQQQCNIVFNYLLLKILELQVTPFYVPDPLKDFIRLLNNPTLTKEELQLAQKELHYSYSQLARLFKKHFNCTITQYVNQVKMNYAKELLSSTDIPISQIIEELQFDESHFHHLFKRTFQCTPLQYRNK